MNPNTLTKYWIETNHTVHERIEEKLISDARRHANEVNKIFYAEPTVPYWLIEE